MVSSQLWLRTIFRFERGGSDLAGALLQKQQFRLSVVARSGPGEGATRACRGPIQPGRHKNVRLYAGAPIIRTARLLTGQPGH